MCTFGPWVHVEIENNFLELCLSCLYVRSGGTEHRSLVFYNKHLYLLSYLAGLYLPPIFFFMSVYV